MNGLNIKMPSDVETILNKINDCGFQAYIVGGCVRDSILGRNPHDWDICTSALPDQIKAIFKENELVLSGEKHGTVGVIMNGAVYEITTFRSDGQYTDHRHPDSVTFESNIESDLMRRDFSINAMAYSNETGLVDLYDGLNDLKNGVIKCVGNPNDRFSEDPLRILRAIRFATRFAFQIDECTFESIIHNAYKLSSVSAERVCSEITQILETDHKNLESCLDGLYLLLYCLELYRNNEIWFSMKSNIVTAIVKSNNAIEVRLALMYHYCTDAKTGGNIDIKEELKRLRFSSEIISCVPTIIDSATRVEQDLPEYVQDHKPSYLTKRLVHDIEIEKSKMVLNYIDALYRMLGLSNLRKYIQNINRQIDQIENGNYVYTLKQLSVNGNDIMSLGYSGQDIGIVLNELLDMIMKSELSNDRNALMEYASKTIRRD